MPPHSEVLVVAAHALEIEALSSALREQPELGRRCTVGSVGVGVASAGAGTARLLHEHAPSCVVLLGSAGVYPERFAFTPAEVVAAERIELLDAARVAGRAQVPDVMQTHATTTAALADALCAAANVTRRVAVATTSSITTDDGLATELATTSCDVENLEALPIALACQAADVPFAAVLGITNRVGSQGRAQWQAHHRDAAKATARALLAWLTTTG